MHCPQYDMQHVCSHLRKRFQLPCNWGSATGTHTSLQKGRDVSAASVAKNTRLSGLPYSVMLGQLPSPRSCAQVDKVSEQAMCCCGHHRPFRKRDHRYGAKAALTA